MNRDSGRRGARRALLAGALFGALATAALASEGATWRLDRATTSIGFEPGLLEAFGVKLVEIETSAEPYAPGSRFLRFASDGPSALELRAPRGAYRGVGPGELRHRGGFALRSESGERIDGHGFLVTAAPEPYELAVRSATGELLFVTSHTHVGFDRENGMARFLNADLRIALELAERLGNRRLEGLAVGQLDLEARLDDGGVARLVPCPEDFASPNDVELTVIGLMSQRFRDDEQLPVRVALAGSATIENHGPGDVEWKSAIAPDSDPGRHPFLSQAFYRLSADGNLEMIGLADVKHAFFSVNSGCNCDAGHVLYAGCSDTYGESNNSDRRYLGPRDELTANTVDWTSLGSHFDIYPAEPEDDIRDHTASGHDGYEHRLVVLDEDLDDEGARYFIELWYPVANDSNPWNNIAWREFTPSLSGGWAFAAVGGTVPGPAIDEWVDPLNLGAYEASTTLDTGEGRLKVASRATEVEGGWRYDYALLNFDFDRGISGFSVPVGASSGAADPAFRGAGLAAPAAPWSSTLDATTVHWDAGAGDALDWGTLFGFSFTSPYPPKTALATLAVFEAGSFSELEAAVVAPGELIFADGFESANTSAWSAVEPL